MTTLRARIDSGFEAFGRTIYRHRLKVLLALLVVQAVLASQLRYITYDASTEAFFRQSDPALVSYERFREQFGRDEFIAVAIAPPDVFDRGFLERLGEFHAALEQEVPHLKEVSSLISARNTRGEGDRLIVEDLLKELPSTPEQMATLKARVLTSELYPNLFISENGRFTTVLVETQAFSGGKAPDDLLEGFSEASPKMGGDAAGAAEVRQPLSDEENSAIVKAVERVMARFAAPDFPVYLTGSPVVTDFLKRAMQSNMARFLSLAVLAIGLFLGLLFRRISGVVLPLLVVALSLVSTVGLMATLGVAFKLPLMILPSFLLAVGVGASVHILSVFYRNYGRGESKEDALAHALGHSGLPIFMAGLTTAAGLLSFITAALASVADLGVFAGLGVMLSLVYSLVLVPALLALVPLRRTARLSRPLGSREPLADRMLTAIAGFSTRRAGTVVAVSLVLGVVAAAGLPWLRFSHNTLLWFPKSGALRQNTELIDRELKGSMSLELVVDTGRENGLYEPETLHRLEALTQYAADYIGPDGAQFVGKTNSVVDVVKEINRALNENRSEFYRIPPDRGLIAQELLLFENSGSDDLQRMVDSQFRIARISIKTPWKDAAYYADFVRDMDAQGRRVFGNTAQVTVTGLIRLFTESVVALMHSMVTSYTIAIVVISVLMILLLGRVRLGLLSMIPNLLPIVMTLGFMGWVGISLDAFTLLIGSIALGLAVDDTIHFFHNYQRYYAHSGDSFAAVRDTLLTTGRAMLITTLVLVTGFWLFMFATMNNLFYFGLLTGLTLIVALLADLLLAPAMLELIARRARAAAAGELASENAETNPTAVTT